MTTAWGWRPERSQGIWRHGAVGLRPLVAAVPFVTVVLLLVMLYFVSGTLTIADGTLFALPDVSSGDAIARSPVALVLPVHRETMVFFDDTRYLLGDAVSERALSEQLAARFRHSDQKTLLVLADRRVSSGDLMRFASLARQNGVARAFFAERRRGTGE